MRWILAVARRSLAALGAPSPREVSRLNAKIQEQQRQLSCYRKKLHFYEKRDYGEEIMPLSHNTAEKMNQFFEEIHDTVPYAEFGRALRVLLDQHDVNASNKSIVDWGVGPGLVLQEILKDCKTLAVTGFDTAESALQHARRAFPEGRFEVQDIYHPPSEQFHLVICTEVLEHLRDPEVALGNLWKMKNRQGTIILTVPDGRMDYSRLHINFWSPESWSLFLEKNLPPSAKIIAGTFAPHEGRATRNNFALISER